MMHLLSASIPFLFLGLVSAHGYGYGGGYRKSSSGYTGPGESYDCGGTCGGGCSTGHCGGSSEPIIETSSGCDSGDCGGSYGSGGGGGYRTSHSSSSHAGYHKSSRTVVKETRNDELKITIGAPKQTYRTSSYVEAAPVIRRTTYIEPQPVIIKKTYISEPVRHKVRYVDEGYGDGGCSGPCGGSKIVKVIKKTTYTDGGYGGSQGSCSSCDYSSGGDIEYAQPTVVKKVTRIISQPKVVTTRVIKTHVVDQPSSGEFYEDSGPAYSGGGYGGGHRSGGGSKAYAFASAGAGSGSYGSGGGGGGCKSGCDEWKKK